jgi:5-methylthioadenosine/S-adenosylhomocysteine deaminase
MRYSTVFGLLLLGWFAAWSARADVAVTPGASDKHVFHGMLITANGIIDGKLVVEGDTITCAAADCPEPAGASQYQVTDAFLFPGFIDSHNHVAYNILPRWTPTKAYQNRTQWQREAAYKTFKAPYDRLKAKPLNLLCEMVKYGEAKALLSGITTIQGSPAGQKCFRPLIRNAESEVGLPVTPAHIRTHILDISVAPTIDWSQTQAFVVHVAEGIDEKSRAEFQVLAQKHLLTSGTAIIHGTAFGAAEFEAMGAAGAKLIWSPQSNLALYRQTTRVDLALAAGVPVSIGVDWNLTGSDSLFDELRVAAQVNEERFQHAIPDSDWAKMVTENPAKALALDAYIGDLAPGKKADITVVRQTDADPNRSLLKNRIQDVQMVWVGGQLLYGNAALVESVRPGTCEALLVRGAEKRICVKYDAQPSRPQDRYQESLAEITQKLRDAYPGLAPLAP